MGDFQEKVDETFTVRVIGRRRDAVKLLDEAMGHTTWVPREEWPGDYVPLRDPDEALMDFMTLKAALVGGAGEIGLRILPFQKGLRGFYLVPRLGVGYPMGFMVSGEIGYAFMPGHFALNFGGGGGYASNVGAIPFGNLSIGIGF